MDTIVSNAVTYDLRNNPAWTISLGLLADEFLVEGVHHCGKFLRSYYEWNRTLGRGPVNTESMLEALTFGVLWNLYGEEKVTWGVCEEAMDPDLTISLIPDGHVMPVINHFLLSLWEKGEFKAEVKRIERFAGFFITLSDEEIRNHLCSIVRFAEWFRVRGCEMLGDVTRNVQEFRENAAVHGGLRDDTALRTRHEVEYHLNLLTALVLNCAWRDKFEKSGKKLVVLPGCMRHQAGVNCKARETKLGFRCAGCNESCAVNRAQLYAGKSGIPVVFIQHQSAVFSSRHADAVREEGYAVIGVACALSLQAGGWKAQDEGIPAQCLPLIYSGCARHWVEGQDVPTEVDIGLLMEIIGGANISSQW